jgi:membrane protein DedA with SNARE-associated domain
MRTRLIVAGLVVVLVAVAAVAAVAAPSKPAAKSINALATQECKQDRREDRADFRRAYGGTGAAALRRCVAEEKREARADCEEDRREDRAEFRAEYGGTGKAAFTRCVQGRAALMTASIADWAGDLLQELGYAGLVVLMAVEHIFPPIPSELVLPLAGFEAGRGNLSLVGALVASTAGSLIGATFLYLLARKGGRPLVLRLRRVLRVSEADLDRAEQRFRRHSAWMVVLGRMVPGVRSLVSLPPGLLKMPFGRYLALTFAGSLVWNTALIVAGQQLGSRWEEVGGVVGPIAQWVVVAIIPLTLAAFVVRHRRSNRLECQH